MPSKNLKILISAGSLFLAFIFLWPAPDVNSYGDTTTHSDLTREIIAFYELSAGKKFTDEQKQWIISGSIEEDKFPRYLNHFYDPVFERGLSTETVGINGYLAKHWAQFSSYQTISLGNIANLWGGSEPVISGSWWGDFSYEAAIKNYSKNEEKEAYIALGHILHLIEDMAVPEHARNDPHPGGNLPSYYENWAKNNSAGLTQDLGKRIFNQGRKPIIYSNLENYFNDLASYTNNHFFSPRTINSELYQKPKIIYEDGTFAYGLDENGQYFDLATFLSDRNSDSKIYYIDDSQILQEYWLRLSRQAVVNGAGVIQLFLNQAEAVKQTELSKQKANESEKKLGISLLAKIYNFFTSPEAPIGEPDMVITSEATKALPKILSQKIAAKPEAAVKPTVLAQPKPVPNTTAPTSAQPPASPAVTLVPVPAPAPTPAPEPQVSAPVAFSGGGGGGGSSSNSNNQQPITQPNNQTQNATSTTEGDGSNEQTLNAGDLIINEIMYDLEGSDTSSGKSREWVEIFNNSSREITLTGGSSGWRFNDGSNHLLNEPAAQGSMTISAGGYVILAGDATTFLADHNGFGGTVIDTVMSLNNTSDTISLKSPDGTIIDEVTYNSAWGANGNGKTLEKKSASGGSSDSINWAESSAPGGTPGAANNYELSISSSGMGTDIPATTTISQDTTWTLAGSPYRLFFDSLRRPTVAAGAVLTIEPGVKIIPQGGGYTALEIQGTLQAIATSGAPIIFTSIKDADDLASTTPKKGDWLNIVFSQGSQGNMDYAEFRYGGQGNLQPLKDMVKIIGADININHSIFANSESIALRLVDSNSVVENSTFSDNACGISIDSLVDGDGVTDGGCFGSHSIYSKAAAAAIPQIKNNHFIRNNIIAIETRNGVTPVINNNVFTDNNYPIRIENSYPTVTNSQLANSTTSSEYLIGIAISGRTYFSQDFTVKKDLPYFLETSGPDLSPYIDAEATLTIEPGTVFKGNKANSTLFISGGLVSNGTLADPVIFTSPKDNPQDGDWSNIKFNAGSIGSFAGTKFYFGTVDNTAFPNNPNLPATSSVFQCAADNSLLEYSLKTQGKIAASFSPLSLIERGILTIPLRKASSSPGNLRISIETDLSGNPSGSYVSLTDLDQSKLDFSFSDFKLSFGVGVGGSSGLMASSTYWVTVENLDGPDNQFYVRNSIGNMCLGAPRIWDSLTGLWNESLLTDLVFKIDKIDYFLPIIVDAGASVVIQ